MEIEEFENFDGSRWLRAEPTKARIAALEAQIARLTAPVTEEEMRRLDDDWAESKDDTIEAYRGALTAFLERRMKG